MSGLRGVTLTVRFLCELAMLAALAYWGFTVGDGAGGLAVAGPPLAAVVLGVAGLHLAAQRLPGTPGERQTTRSVTVVRPTARR